MSTRFCQFVLSGIAGILMLTTATASAQEASDTIAGATVIAATPFAAMTDASGATTTPDEPVPGCMFMGGLGEGSLWYRYTATQNGPLSADALGSSYDTVLVVWDGAPGAGGVEVGCNDDFYGLQSAVDFTAEAGHTYYFQIAFWQSPQPFAMLNFRLSPPLPPLEATVTFDAIGRAAGATGVVEIGATVSCNRPAWVRGYVHVAQQHGRIAAAGLMFDGPCDATPYHAIGRFVGQNARFTPGQASVTMIGEAFEFPSGVAPIYTSSELRLQGASPKSLALPPPPAP